MILNPIPSKIPSKLIADKEVGPFIQELVTSVYQMWYALNGAKNPVLISSTENIDVTQVGVTSLFKVPANKTFIPLFTVNRCTAFDGTGKGTQAVVSFGGNSASYDDFLNSITCAISSAAAFQINQPSSGTQLPTQAANDQFSVIVETPSDAAEEKWSVDLFGYLV